ncbi:hypothetical protein NXV26_10480 [Bacteroides fragilis]|nr:hypothetical protein [Bacteroides fragilis]
MYGATAGKVSLLTFEACSNQAVCGVIPTIENMLYYVYFHISSLSIAISLHSVRVLQGIIFLKIQSRISYCPYQQEIF